MQTNLLDRLGNKSITREELAEKVKKNFALLPEIMNGVSSSKAAVRYPCGNILMDLSEECPEKLYPHMDFFIRLLDSKYRILKWIAIAVIANLTKIDSENKFEAVFDKYYGFLEDEYMVTVASVVGHSSKIAQAKPHLIPRMTGELLKVESIKTTPHLTAECRNVIAEKTIKSFDAFFEKVDNKKEVLSFVERQFHKSRRTLRVAAEKFLKKWGA